MLNGYIRIIISSISVYAFIVVAIRLFGKKELAQLSIFDLVFILLISNAVQNAMVGTDTSLLGGLIAASALFIFNYFLKLFLYKFPKLAKIIQGEPLLLIYNGNINHKNIAKAKITNEELMEAIREHGATTLEDINLAVLEVDGNISILSEEYRNKTSRKRQAHKIISKNEN